MNNFLIKKLVELNEKFGADGFKIEFETENISCEQLLEVWKISLSAGLKLVVKLGGCGGVRDILDAKSACADIIVAPMIESVYAMEKFVKTVGSIYRDNDVLPNLYINIETQKGVQNFDNITLSPEFTKICGVVIGRNDLAQSFGIDNTEDKFIGHTVCSIAQKSFECTKDVIIGGKITPEIDFSNFPPFARCETRKIVFKKYPDSCGILKALEFEIYFIESKKNKTHLDYIRLEELKKRIPQIICG